MAAPSNSDLKTQIADLQKEVADLRRRLAAVERLVGATSEHATDRTVVQGKVSYDWQS
ncbi:MAG: hypothetical protein WBG19_07235 [Thermoplasmata archaeon]